MNRLQSELQRLYLPTSSSGGVASLVGDAGTVRALVLELARPANWEELSLVWRGVQTDLEWPAPGIAVSGTDGLQLWFSLAQAVAAEQAHAVLDALRGRYLGELASARLRVWPAVDEASPRHAPLVPAEQGASGNWSAFVAPDLAPVFSDTPWLDIPPGADGQADLLSRLGSITPAAWAAALARLRPAEPVADARPDAAVTPPLAAALDPQRFLMQVMADERAPLALRIEAAKALLPYADKRAG